MARRVSAMARRADRVSDHTYIIDGDSDATKQRLEVKIGPRLTFIRRSGQAA